MANETQNLPSITYYTPVELLGIYRSFLERGKSNGVVWLRGIYTPKQQGQGWSFCFDELHDVKTNVAVTIKLTPNDRAKLKPQSLIHVGGIIELNPFANGTIQILVNVTRIEIVKDQFVTEQDIKRNEIRIAKSKKGFKNVDAVLEEKLFRDERPKVALIFATTSITMADFNAGVNAAAVKIDFTEQRQSFANAKTLTQFLKAIDTSGFDIIALIRGGGSGIESLDDVSVLETISDMETPIICAIGHVGEELFLKSIADKVAPTPNGLGQYFSEMVEKVTAKRNNSRAALIEEVKKQFVKQIEESNKKNKELLAQVEKMTKQAQDQTKSFNEGLKKQQEENKKNLEAQQKKNDETLAKLQLQSKQQMEKANKQNEELQNKLKDLTKTHAEQLGKLQVELKKQTENNEKQTKEFNESIKKMQETNSQQSKAIEKYMADKNKDIKLLNEAIEKNRELEKQLEEALRKNKGCLTGCMGIVAAIISIASFACWLVGIIL